MDDLYTEDSPRWILNLLYLNLIYAVKELSKEGERLTL
jgi:hypothetical protein